MKPLKTIVIGIDCAVDPKKRGVAIGSYDGTMCTVVLPSAKTDKEVALLVSQCVKQSDRILLAMDAPLGWPAALGNVLNSHQAGDPISADANSLFRRETDQFIKEKIGKQPLDVGADRIARTAHSALGILAAIDFEVPLAWLPNFSGTAAIEVYPAATLKAYGLPNTGYKTMEHRNTREQILLGLSKSIESLMDKQSILDNADTLDAVVCVLAGLDFIKDNCYKPSTTQQELAYKEGWIWVKRDE